MRLRREHSLGPAQGPAHSRCSINVALKIKHILCAFLDPHLWRVFISPQGQASGICSSPPSAQLSPLLSPGPPCLSTDTPLVGNHPSPPGSVGGSLRLPAGACALTPGSCLPGCLPTFAIRLCLLPKPSSFLRSFLHSFTQHY